MDSVKTEIQNTIMNKKDELLAFADDIFRHPELGYREYRTKEKVMDLFCRMGLHRISFYGLTGVKAWLSDSPDPSLPRIAILGEMDAVISPQHPFADPQTHAAHACGHFAGLTAMIGAGMALLKSAPSIAGNVCLIAVPAEEYVEISYRQQLLSQNHIRYLGGKQQLIYEGCFDDVDIAMMVHALTDTAFPQINLFSQAGGFIGKSVQFFGKEAHAGGAPYLGVNALNAASAALMCIHAIRETFRDEDHVRVHPIITKGGDIVNTVPADVRMESYVRAANIKAMADANRKVDRAINGGTYAVGASCAIHNLPGYLPLEESLELSEMFAENIPLFSSETTAFYHQPFCGSTDLGDLSFLLPVIQPTVSGFCGELHSKDFCMTDPFQAILLPAMLLAAAASDLLSNNAKKGKKILKDFSRKTKDDYIAMWESILTPDQGGAN